MNDILKDRVSGFKGMVLGITKYDTGCTHYGLAPTQVSKDGLVSDWQWFDESRLTLVKKAKEKSIDIPHSGPDCNPKRY
jgi:hypothetical protein